MGKLMAYSVNTTIKKENNRQRPSAIRHQLILLFLKLVYQEAIVGSLRDN